MSPRVLVTTATRQSARARRGVKEHERSGVNHLAFGVTIVLVLTLVLTATAAAAGPSGTGGEAPGDNTILPLTPEQKASLDYRQSLFGSSTFMAPDASVSPQYACNFDPCEPASRSLTVYARQQTKSYFCGPAVVQVVSNYSWGKTGSNDKYTQQHISDSWTHTDANGQTYLGDEVSGMNAASARPANFAYMQLHAPSYDGWHGTIIQDVYWWQMPLAAGVIPWKSDGAYHLVSWKKVSNGGHDIELHGYVGRVGDATRYVWFSDVAGTYADSIAANYEQSSYAVYQTMMYNNKNMIW